MTDDGMAAVLVTLTGVVSPVAVSAADDEGVEMSENDTADKQAADKQVDEKPTGDTSTKPAKKATSKKSSKKSAKRDDGTVEEPFSPQKRVDHAGRPSDDEAGGQKA